MVDSPPSTTRVAGLFLVPAGTYLVSTTLQVGPATNDSSMRCELDAGTSTVAFASTDVFVAGLNTARRGDASMAISGVATLSATGTIQVVCNTSDLFAQEPVNQVSLNALQIDTLN